MQELNDVEVQMISGGMSLSDGLAAVGVALGAGALAATMPIAAGAAVAAVIIWSAVDIYGQVSAP